jgi:hypothetical protein
LPPKEDTFTPFEAALILAPLTSPWVGDQYRPDLGLLEQLVSIPVASGATSETGRFPKAFDVWAAHELRRAGFDVDEVWPRSTRPRVLPRDVKLLLDRMMPVADREKLAIFLANHANAAMIAPVEARVLGRVFTKQADVLIAHWARGVELLVSTKTMVSSYGNNLRNRFEESYGDAINLRGRFPLATLGFLFAVRSNIPAADLIFLRDMLDKLRESSGYDATCLIIVEWAGTGPVILRSDMMHDNLSPSRFLSDMVGAVLDRTPIDHHVAVRNLRVHTELPIAEGQLDVGAQDDTRH